MHIHFTARKFKAHNDVREHAINSVKKLDKYYDGVVRTDIILSYERPSNSVKTAEINLHVHGTILTAKERSEDFHKSIDLVIGKIERQLAKYKTKVRLKNKRKLRRVKQETVEVLSEDEE
ncbi:MAG: ribosome-associated translation inhibitor RaiA [Ignavibacteriae bacterium]|nr:ribosome-associated translation inhibitor RaiA [Ignavibacteriota bacterium]